MGSVVVAGGFHCSAACGILIPQPGIEPMPPALEVQSFNHWTSKETPWLCGFIWPARWYLKSWKLLLALKNWEILHLKKTQLSQIVLKMYMFCSHRSAFLCGSRWLELSIRCHLAPVLSHPYCIHCLLSSMRWILWPQKQTWSWTGP